MSQPVSKNTQYFLGIGGQQSGPFSEADLIEKIKNQSVPKDALVWCEGMPNWVSLTSLPQLKPAPPQPSEPKTLYTPPAPTPAPAPAAPATSAAAPIAAAATITPAKPASVSQILDNKDKKTTKTFGKGKIETVFSAEEATFTHSPFIKYRMEFIIGGVILLCLGTLVGFYIVASSMGGSKFKLVLKAEDPNSKREAALRKIQSEFILNPANSSKELEKLILENPNDAVSKTALQTLISYYRNSQRFDVAGRLLISLQKPEEAYVFFLQDPQTIKNGEQALYLAYGKTADKNLKQKYLLEDIQVLVSRLNDYPLATQRIIEFDKNFPGVEHPYQYYLKSNADKIKDIFGRLEKIFTKTQLSYLDSIIPRVQFGHPPKTEIKKLAQGYRIVANYFGDISLNQDRLSQIYFVFWFYNQEWQLVDTNLTPDRKRWTEKEKAKRDKEYYTEASLLSALEQMFRKYYPKNALHEVIKDTKN
jgi:hypothetical protein